jgi:glycosyltransferase involved in cell wall biosynthesis
VHWWFAYNDLSVGVVRDLGYPDDRITSVGNAIDTRALVERRTFIAVEELASIRSKLGLQSDHVAVYTGGLYANKRLGFLLDAAERIRKHVTDFELIVIGDGPDLRIVTEAAARNPWIHDVGPKNDRDKVPYWALSKLLLMPGGVGLVVLDSFALGVPMVTTDTHLHGPEIDYLKDGVNGLLIECGESVETYADGVVALLRDESRLERLRQGALASAAEYTIEQMASNFADGVMRALATPRL